MYNGGDTDGGTDGVGCRCTGGDGAMVSDNGRGGGGVVGVGPALDGVLVTRMMRP